MSRASKILKEIGKTVNSAAMIIIDIKAMVVGEVSNYDALKDRSIDLCNKMTDLQQGITALTEQNFSLVEKNSAIKKKNMKLQNTIANMKAFEADAVDYELVSIGPDSHVYALKNTENTNTPATYLCCACFDAGKKSTLQLSGYEHNTNVLSCNKCGSKYRKRIEGRDQVMSARSSPRGVW